MKIHSNPNVPLAKPATDSVQTAGDSDTLRFIRDLEARNQRALTQLRGELRPIADVTLPHIHHVSSCHRRFSVMTGPPIETPDGHVHAITGAFAFGNEVSE